MAVISIGAVIGISVGAAVVVILIGVLIVCLAGKGRANRDSRNLQELPGKSSRLSRKRQVINISGRFEHGYTLDVQDVLPPRGRNEPVTHDSFVLDADTLRPQSDIRMSYDRPYSFRVAEHLETNRAHTASGFGQVSMYSSGGIRTSDNSINSMDSDFVTSQTSLLPKSQGLRDPANRPPAQLPSKPYIIYQNQPVSRPRVSNYIRPDSFRASNAVDLGAQPEKAWMLSSLEKEKYSSPRRY